MTVDYVTGHTEQNNKSVPIIYNKYQRPNGMQQNQYN